MGIKLFVLILALIVALCALAYAADEIETQTGLSVPENTESPPTNVITNHGWGSVQVVGNRMVIEVREEFTKRKAGLNAGYAADRIGSKAKVSDNLTDSGKKYLGIIWSLPGVANLRFSTYVIVIAKGGQFQWDEIAPKIYETMDGWHKEATKNDNGQAE